MNIKIKKDKKIKYLICIVLFAMVLIICFLSYNIFKNSKLKSRTIMIYMVGSNLESDAGLATTDLNSIDYNIMDNKNVKVVLIAGGSETWNNDYIDKDETSIYELKENGFVKIKENSLQNMGDKNVLAEFLNYSYKRYKSDEYDLIFWNHGGAIQGSEFDDLSDDYLSLKEISEGLENSKFNSKNKLELIMFRTCLNGTLEMSSMINEYADYLVASEEVTIGTKFTSVLDFINNINLKDNGYDVGLKFINSYKNQINEYKNVYSFNQDEENPLYSTYSIVKLSNVNNLIKSINEFVSDIDVTNNYNEIAKVRSNLYQYAYTQADEESYDMIDLYNLIDKLKKLSPSKANKVLKELNKTILYNWATNSESRGISIYFPYNGSSKIKNAFLNIYDDFTELDDYKKFITKFNQIQESSTKKYSFSDNKTNIKTVNNTSDFEVELTKEQLEGFAKAEYFVFESVDTEGYYRPIYRGKNVLLDGNKLSASIKGRLVKAIDKKNKDSDYVVFLKEIEENDNYIKYWTSSVISKIPGVNDDFKFETESINMNLIRDKKTDEIKITSVIKSEEAKDEILKPNTVALDIKDYTTISFGSMGWNLIDKNGNYNENFDRDGIFRGMEYNIENLEFKVDDFSKEKDYYCVFRIYDVNNNYYYSKVVKMN